MSFQLTVLYHHPADPAAFDEHYATTHAPLAARIEGLSSYTSLRPGPDPEGNAPAEHLVATLVFPDAAAFQAGMTGEAGLAAAADIANFASGGVTMLTGEVETYV